MQDILLIGENPPFLMGDVKIEAAHYRTAQFLEPLLDSGYSVTLVAPLLDGGDTHAFPTRRKDLLVYRAVDFTVPGWEKALQRIHDDLHPLCIIAVNFDFCLYATKLHTTAPIWMDIYGDPLTIMQAATYRAGSDRGLSTFTGLYRQVLKKGDAFSVCSTPQKHMLIGELAMAGRLNRHSFGHEFVNVIRPGAPSAGELVGRNRDESLAFLGEAGVSQDSFVVLWAGGYNTWTDVDTLFDGLSSAMDQVPNLVYVSVGASTYSGKDDVYQQFRQLIAVSPHKSRFILLGWRPWTEMPNYYRASDVGINIDALHYETIYGTRTRLVEMISEGLPVVTTFGTELSYLLVEAGVGLGFDPSDSEQFGDHLVRLASDQTLRNQMSSQASSFAQNTLSFAATTNSVQEWVKGPRIAPDRVEKTGRQELEKFEHETRARVRWALWRWRGSFR